jgi:Tol biopolymer transport system component
MITILVALGSTLGQLPSGQIAFVQQLSDDVRQVCLLDTGTGEIRTIGAGPWDGAPVWSPDGTKLAYEEAIDEKTAGIHAGSPDGPSITAITHTVPLNHAPAWSPDGKRLAYAAGERQSSGIRVYDFTTGEESEWGKGASPDDPKPKIAFMQPVWQSDSVIVAVGVRDDKEGRTTDLYEIEKDDASLMVEERGGGTYVEWLPAVYTRKSMLAYESNDGGDREIFVSAPQRGVIDVSNHRAADWNPVWSSDGEWLAFESYRGGSRGIYKVTPQRTVVTSVVTDAASDNWSPAWSPDGAWIAFVSTRDGKPTLYACRADGTEQHALTNHDGQDLAPAWRPVKTK